MIPRVISAETRELAQRLIGTHPTLTEQQALEQALLFQEADKVVVDAVAEVKRDRRRRGR